MKKIYFTLIILLLAMSGMAYLYFSRLNRESTYNEISLHAATENSGLVFCLHNDKSVFDILKGQDLFQHLLGEEKFSRLDLLKKLVISNASVNNLIINKDVFISFSGGKNKEINYLISTQLNNEQDQALLTAALQTNGIKVAGKNGIMQLSLNDSTVFYLGLEKNLVLLSDQQELVSTALKVNPSAHSQKFISYIKSNNKLSKNSLGNLFIDFNKIPALLRSMLPGSLNGNLALFNHQDAFAALNYNFSSERLFFTGNTTLNNAGNYLSLYADKAPQKNTIDNLLPENTANFRLYAIPGYPNWRKALNAWFEIHHEDKKVKNTIASTDKTYRLDAEKILPVYFRDQLITFQLRTGQHLGAINLTNGDRVQQLLLDISDDYDQDIKILRIPDLLYCYFGEPVKKFSKPYYVIIDNNLVFANQPAALNTFLQDYRNNKLLISTEDYINLYGQISNMATVTFYVNHKNSADLVRNTIYMPYYRHFLSAAGLARFSSMIYQLSGDKGSFQSNLLINTLPAPADQALSADSIRISQ